MTTQTQSTLEIVAASFQGKEVSKLPLFGPDNMPTNGVYGLWTADGNHVGNTVKRGYVPHQTDDVLAMVEAVETVFDGCEAKCHFDHGHYVELAPSNDYRLSIFGSADNVFPRLNISAGYNGKCFDASIGYYRDLCRNLAELQSVQSTRAKIRHTSGLRSKINALVEQFKGLRDGWQTLGETIQRMEATEVSLASFLDTVYEIPSESAGRAITTHRNRTEAIFRRVVRERMQSGRPDLGSDYVVSAWEAFNGVQGYVQHDMTRQKNPSDFAHVLLAKDTPAVKAAEIHALELCA